MKALIFDVETTTSNRGNPFDKNNRLIVAGFLDAEFGDSTLLYHDDEQFDYIQNALNDYDLYVGFNIKFDIHWLIKCGFTLNPKARVWDCQIAEFLISNQKNSYPSLNDACERFNLTKKLDIVKEEYWEKGIDTADIPRDILSEYLEQDLRSTYDVWSSQRYHFEKVEPHKYALFRLMCADLLVLREMEYHGIKFNVDKALEQAKEVEKEMNDIKETIAPYFFGNDFNLDSNDHLSCLLYGGDIKYEDRIPIGVYKTGQKIGQTRYKILERTVTLPRLIQPLKGSELQKNGYWSTDDKTLRTLKGNKEAKKLITLIRKYSELSKLASTYLRGYPKLIEKMNWDAGMLHGNLNQCVAITGRLSSTNPNLQNADPQTKRLMESRYAT